MQSLSNIFQHSDKLQKIVTKTNRGIRSERDEMVAKFHGHGIKIRDRKTKQLVPATLADLALLLRHCPTSDLHAFHQECMKAKNFAMFFWWAVKGRKQRTLSDDKMRV